MLNDINMQLYRMKKSKEFYVILGLLLMSSVLSFVIIGLTDTAQFDTITEGIAINFAGGNVLFFFTILISMFVIGEFSSGYIKNIAVTHDNRNRLILSKLPVIALSLLFYCVFNMVLLSIGYSLLIPEIPFGSFLTLFKILGLYYMLYFAVSTAVVAVAVAIRNMTWALMISLLWSTGIPAYLYTLLEMMQRRFLGDVYIKFTRIFADAFIVARPELAQGSEILYIIGITVLYTAVWIFLSLFFIKKQDIK